VRSITILLGALAIVAPAAGAQRIASPDGRIEVRVSITTGGEPRYVVARDGRDVLRPSKLGLVRDDADFSASLHIVGTSAVERVVDDYEILTAKRRINHYRANRRVVHLRTAAGAPMDIVFQVSNDGVAFRYVFSDTSATMHDLREERTSFHLPSNARAWLQPIAQAKTGFEKSNPSYEEHYQKDVPVGGKSSTGAGWVYPALFHSGDTWLLVSESGLGRNYAGTRLRSEAPDGEYSVGFPDSREGQNNGPVNPRSRLPWRTPWRVIAVGSLRTIAESMLGVDVAEPALAPPGPTIVPGKASWSWPLMGDGATNYEVQRRFIDYAADMRWRYCLVDALWDKQITDAQLKELIAYGKSKGVRLLLWYNSAGDWNTTPQTPRDRMLTHESRVAEFSRLRDLGIAGVKVDFFGGDGQSVIAYYHDILNDAATYGLLVNFHGATLPRGWQRTYPNLMTMEAIKGLEFVTFGQHDADEEPTHAAMLPFTRNVFDPMDFTPMVLDKIRRIQRRTSSAFELALSVLFTSGIQHYAEIPDGMANVPEYVREFLRGVPGVWDDVRFLDGYPGRYAIFARRGEGGWYIAGINADSTARTMTVDLRDIPGAGGTLITDGGAGNLSFRQSAVRFTQKRTFEITLAARGGFVLRVDAERSARSASSKTNDVLAEITIPNADDVRGNVTLPLTVNGAAVIWTSSEPRIVSDKANGAIAAGAVTRPPVGAPPARVTLTACTNAGGDKSCRTFALTVPSAVRLAEFTRYGMVNFARSNSQAGQQIFMAASVGNDPTRWVAVNGGHAVLESAKGMHGVRDPSIVRSPEGDKFYLIATDLNVDGRDYGWRGWDWAQSGASRYIEVWESTDLRTWSEQRHVLVAPEEAGMTFAPEAIWDPSIGAYVVYWTSSMYPTGTRFTTNRADPTGRFPITRNQTLYATTRDFITFTPPRVMIDRPNHGTLDAVIIRDEKDGSYHRFVSDRISTGVGTTKYAASCNSEDIYQERATSVLAPPEQWTLVAACITHNAMNTTYAEAPMAIKANRGDARGEGYYLWADQKWAGSPSGNPMEEQLHPYWSADLSSGKWTPIDWTQKPNYDLALGVLRHGNVFALTSAEHAALMQYKP